MEEKDIEVRQKPHYRDPHCQGKVGSLSPEAIERALASLLKLLKTKYMSDRQVNKKWMRASLVAQWLRIRLPMQETRVQALVWEDPTCHGATKPMRHNY